MTPQLGRGMQVLKTLVSDALERMPRDDARSFIDALSAEKFADTLDALSAAGVATGTGGNLFYESAATRIRAADERLSERETRFPRTHSTVELMGLQGLTLPVVDRREYLPLDSLVSSTPTGVTVDLSKVKRRFLRFRSKAGTTVVEELDSVGPQSAPAKRSTTSRTKKGVR